MATSLSDAERLKEIYQTAEQASGSALNEQSKYADSIQYSLDQLTAHGEEFWHTFIKKDDVKEFINLLNGIISADTKIVDTFGSIPSIAGVLGGVAAFKNIGGDKMYSLLF